eukprot:3587507-Pyramimonas_sp.AAC.1
MRSVAPHCETGCKLVREALWPARGEQRWGRQGFGETEAIASAALAALLAAAAPTFVVVAR